MPLEVVQLPLGAFQSNCYVVGRSGGEEAIVVDPGWPGETARVQAALGAARCAAILVTHGDLDHIGGVAELVETTGAPVYMPAGERDRLERPGDYAPYGVEVSLAGHTPDVLLEGGEELDLAGIHLESLHVPGHTGGHVAFAAEGHLFSGDVLFAGSVGRTDRADGDWDALLASIRALVEHFPPETIVHPGHGPATTLGHELDTNPFLAELRAPAP
jgi:hydroxyacylglutathione hydrolase